MSREVVVVDGLRTPYSRAGTELKDVPADELGRIVAVELLARTDFDPEGLDEVIFGNIAQPPDAVNVARVAALRAGVPHRVPAFTVNRLCGSGLQSIVDAHYRIAAGQAEAILAGGVESMSNIPLLFSEEFKDVMFAAMRAKTLPARLAAWSRLRPRHFKPIIGLEAGLTDPLCGLNMGQTAEVLAAEFGISREEQDRFALESHRRAVAAASLLREEMTPIFAPAGAGRLTPLHDDVGPRAGQTIEALAKLKPYFDKVRGTITAGNSSPITDGAAAVVVAHTEAMEMAATARPLARIRSWASAGLSPRRMGLGPAYAVPRALAEARVSLADVDLVEINEAFSAQVIACVTAMASQEFARHELGLASAVGELRPERTNVNGGAIALGHPVGASGARLVLTLAHEMSRRGAGLGLATLCIGGGQGSAMVLEAA